MRSIAWIGIGVLCAMLYAPPAGVSAAENLTSPPPSQQSPPPATLKSLLDQGFEIKNVLYLSGATSTRQAQQMEQPTVLITLQKSASTAACWFALSLWITQQISTGTCNVLR